MRAPQHGWRDCVVWVDQDEDGFYIDVGDCDSEYVTEIEAEWLGPITPDSYQQGRRAGHIEGLREAVQYRCFYCSQTHLWLPVDHEGWHATERQGIKTHCNAWPIHQRIAVLAQQAQDEKGVGE